MHSAFHKAKKLVKRGNFEGSEAKAKTQQENESRNNELDTDISALELKEFLELEMKAQQQMRPDWLRLIQSRNKGKTVTTKELIMGVVRQPFIHPATPDIAKKTKVQSSMNEQVAAKDNKRADIITRSLISDIELNIKYNTLHSKVKVRSSTNLANGQRKRSITNVADRPSLLIKNKTDIESEEAANNEVPREEVKKPEALGVLVPSYPFR